MSLEKIKIVEMAEWPNLKDNCIIEKLEVASLEEQTVLLRIGHGKMGRWSRHVQPMKHIHFYREAAPVPDMCIGQAYPMYFLGLTSC